MGDIKHVSTFAASNCTTGRVDNSRIKRGIRNAAPKAEGVKPTNDRALNVREFQRQHKYRAKIISATVQIRGIALVNSIFGGVVRSPCQQDDQHAAADSSTPGKTAIGVSARRAQQRQDREQQGCSRLQQQRVRRLGVFQRPVLRC